MSESLVQCSCCDYFSLPPDCGWEICPICFWECDSVDLVDLDGISGPNHMSLREGRANFVGFGACEERFRTKVLPKEKLREFRYAGRGV
ncbi:MAG: CPCC family cysteine-rich protein [Pseudomonadota bacterium]